MARPGQGSPRTANPSGHHSSWQGRAGLREHSAHCIYKYLNHRSIMPPRIRIGRHTSYLRMEKERRGSLIDPARSETLGSPSSALRFVRVHGRRNFREPWEKCWSCFEDAGSFSSCGGSFLARCIPFSSGLLCPAVVPREELIVLVPWVKR